MMAAMSADERTSTATSLIEIVPSTKANVAETADPSSYISAPQVRLDGGELVFGPPKKEGFPTVRLPDLRRQRESKDGGTDMVGDHALLLTNEMRLSNYWRTQQ